MTELHDRTIVQRDACAAHATLQWALYALPPRHPARLTLMLATARADRDRQASVQPAEEHEQRVGVRQRSRRPGPTPR